ATYALGRRTILRGGFGRFAADRVHTIMLVDAWAHGSNFPSFDEAFLRSNSFAREYPRLPDVPPITAVFGAAASGAFRDFLRTGAIPVPVADSQQILQALHPGLPNPDAYHWGIEVERRLTGNLFLTAGYAGLSAANLPLVVNRNLRPAI